MAKRQSDPKAYLTRFYPAVVVAALLALGGCGASADDITCGEYADMEFEDQTSAIQSLLAEHDLDENDTGNIRSLKASVANFCGSGSSTIPGRGTSTLVTETTNPDGKLNDAPNWSGSRWRPADPTTLDFD
ncbi:MAG: hypothetical protein JHC71_00415 [Blastococcus sp.]|nr:hypothetical protein [Blastococcus sp.]